MKNLALFIVFILLLVLIQFAQGQSVDEVINKYIDARGGRDKLNALQSLYMEGSRQMMGNEVAVKVTKVQGKLFRNDFEFGGTSGYTIVTPAEGWSFIPMRSQKSEPIPAERLKTMQTDMDIPGPLVDYAAKGHKAEFIGKEDIDSTEAYKVKLTTSSGKEIIYFFDAKTNLLMQTRQMSTGMGGRGNANSGPAQEREVITNYTDYREVEGIMFPHTMSTAGAGPGAGSMTFDKIELNKTIDESQYKPSN